MHILKPRGSAKSVVTSPNMIRLSWGERHGSDLVLDGFAGGHRAVATMRVEARPLSRWEPGENVATVSVSFRGQAG